MASHGRSPKIAFDQIADHGEKKVYRFVFPKETTDVSHLFRSVSRVQHERQILPDFFISVARSAPVIPPSKWSEITSDTGKFRTSRSASALLFALITVYPLASSIAFRNSR